MSRNVCTAVYGSCRGCDNVYLGYVQINGNRPALGYVAVKNGGTALLEFGGNSMGQKIEGIRAYEPRGWSAIHAKGKVNGLIYQYPRALVLFRGGMIFFCDMTSMMIMNYSEQWLIPNLNIFLLHSSGKREVSPRTNHHVLPWSLKTIK